MNNFNLRAASKLKFQIFHVYTAERNELYKEKEENREVQNPATVFVDVPALAA